MDKLDIFFCRVDCLTYMMGILNFVYNLFGSGLVGAALAVIIAILWERDVGQNGSNKAKVVQPR